MLIEYALYAIPRHKEEEFITRMANAVEVLKRNQYCYGCSLRQSNTEVINFILEISWQSIEGHVNGFRRTNEYITFLEIVLPYVPFVRDMDFFHKLGFSWERPVDIFDFSTIHTN